jgi:hypothetical protein
VVSSCTSVAATHSRFRFTWAGAVYDLTIEEATETVFDAVEALLGFPPARCCFLLRGGVKLTAALPRAATAELCRRTAAEPAFTARLLGARLADPAGEAAALGASGESDCVVPAPPGGRSLFVGVLLNLWAWLLLLIERVAWVWRTPPVAATASPAVVVSAARRTATHEEIAAAFRGVGRGGEGAFAGPGDRHPS